MSQQHGILGLDRKAMEEERLARLAAKRKRTNESETLEDTKTKVNKTENLEPVLSKRSNQTQARDSRLEPGVSNTESQYFVKHSSKLQYPHGIVKKTWAFGYERQSDIKIEEVLQRNDLKCAVVSSWQWDFDWLVSKIDPANTKFVFVMEAKTDSEKERIKGDFRGLEKRIRLCFPPMSKANTFESAFRALTLSLLIGSAFLIDLPRLPNTKHGHQNDTLTGFARSLLKFLRASEVFDDITESVMRYDFSETSRYAFVHSIPGSYTSDDESDTGLHGLSQAIAQLGLSTPLTEPLEIDFAASSVGSLNGSQINDFKECLRGLKDPSKADSSRADTIQKTRGTFRIVFPTVETVRNSNGSFNNGGTIFLSPNAMTSDSFPSSLLRNYQSTRKGLLSHNKLIFVRSPSTAFFYTGSANISQSAWGRITGGTRSKTAKMTISNWECGVLVPVVKSSTPEKGKLVEASKHRKEESKSGEDIGGPANLDESSVQPMSVFETIYRVPFEWPPKAYSKSDKPWSASMQHKQ